MEWNWETIVVCTILLEMALALIHIGDRLDHWTFMGVDTARPPRPVLVYGMTMRQIRRLRAYYVTRTGDTGLDRLERFDG